MEPTLEWDENKAGSNLSKHGVSFQEAATVFADPLAAIFDDEDHSVTEDREIIIGMSHWNRLVIVSFTERGDSIRIISDRFATPTERSRHEESTFR